MIEKTEARQAAFERRKTSHEAGRHYDAQRRLLDWLRPYQGKALAGYMPIRTEIDPLPVMDVMSELGPVCVPVIDEKDAALKFAKWTPGCLLEKGPFGAMIPASPDWITPDVLIVPLVAFDATGSRLGYGGGFYDRTLETLRRTNHTRAVGFAYDGQEAESLPLEATDQPLDAVVTETRTLTFSD